MRTILLALCFSLSTTCFGEDKALEVYFIDVEGGQATLIVSPSGESLLVDTGWPGFNGRDADRIVAAARAAGLQKLDYVLITHYHRDHVGGVTQLAERIPVGVYLDHGGSVESGEQANALMAAYNAAVVKARRLGLKPGDKLPIKGLEVTVLTAAGETIAKPVAGEGKPNALCAEAKPQEDDPGENAQSVGILIRHGKFRMINLGDLTWNEELKLACPVNRAGPVDVYLTTHHGGPSSGAPAIVHALRPRVAIMNNGARKGGNPDSIKTVRTSPGLEDMWQIHYAMEAGNESNSQKDFIANLEEQCEGRGIKLSAEPSGAFAVTNLRNGFAKSYAAR
jgi:beta-lactamase superfamily II metal-dependent hydrolase